MSRNISVSRRNLLGAAAGAALGRVAAPAATAYRRDLTKEDIDHLMTELSNWGRWGKDDQSGTVNLITPAKRKQAAALVKDGYSVSLALDADIPPESAKGAPPAATTWQHAMRSHGLNMRGPSGYAVDSYTVSFHGNSTTHLDALSHYIHEGHIYNGFPASSITGWGATKNDVDLDAWEKRAGVKLESDDAVLVRTGRWARVAAKGPLNLNQVAPGLYARCAKWLKVRDIAVFGSDAVQDVRPSRVEGVNQPLHQIFLVAAGTPLFDSCGRATFLLTVAPLPVPGGTGSPFNPIATF